MCKWPPVYIEYTHKLVLLAVCIPGIQHALRVYGGRLVKFSSLRQIGFNLAEFKKISCMKSDITCSMYIYHLFQSDIFYHFKKIEAWGYCNFSFVTFLFHQQGFFSRPFWELKKV